MALSTVAVCTAGACMALVYCSGQCLWNIKRSSLLPPRPPGLPWIGNVIGVNVKAPWLTYTEWAKTYGDLICTRLFGRDIIIINSEKIAKDLLDKRSLKHSDRPLFITNQMWGLDFATGLLPYGDRWRQHRRIYHQTFRNEAVTRFLPLQHDKGCQLLRQLFCTPEKFWQHVSEYSHSVVLNSTYGHDPQSYDDTVIKTVAELQKIGAELVNPSVLFTFEALQILLKLPAWFPGMSFKKLIPTGKKLVKQYVESTFEHSLQMVGTSTAPSMVRDAMQNLEELGTVVNESSVKALKEAAATSCFAGSHTTRSLLITFFLVMALNPAVQERAQAQIDAVISKDRLPAISDRSLLPFIDAILLELLRFRPLIPLSVPHAAVVDDSYEGFHIPKGAILIANVWAMAHDESRFPDPYKFKPERFLNEDGSLKPNNIEHLAYGFGRRICVGRHFANTSLWSVIAKVLAIFTVRKPLDENGLEVDMEPEYMAGGFGTLPLSFRCRIMPRAPEMDAVALEELISASGP